MHRKSPWELLRSSLVSLMLVLVSQFALAMVPRIFPSLSLLAMVPVSVLVLVATMALSRGLRWLIGVSGSAPALVLFNVLFLWGVYVAVIRGAISSLLDAIFNAECALLLFGFYRILTGDPGVVAHQPSSGLLEMSDPSEVTLQGQNSPLFLRVRYCKSCNTSIRGFDHHCPAFGNCIGQKNHRLFMVLLTGFIISEASYTMCATQFIAKSLDTEKAMLESNLSGNLVLSTLLFSILQLLWQVFFLIWHVYCICFNIKTDEWINWQRYPEFQLAIQTEPGWPVSEPRFSNPYNRGIISNIKGFLKQKE